MKKGRFTDRPTPEQEAEEAPYMEDWEGKVSSPFSVSCQPRKEMLFLISFITEV